MCRSPIPRTEDKAIPPALQRFMTERANATIVEVPASHVAFVSQPDAATELILQAVNATMPGASRTQQSRTRDYVSGSWLL